MSAATTPHPISPLRHPTQEAFLQQWLPLVLATVATAPGFGPAQARDTTLTLINALHPRDPAEAALAGLCIATLFAGMESLRQSQEPALPPHLAARLRAGGFTAVRLVLSLLHKLQQDENRSPDFLPTKPPGPWPRQPPRGRSPALIQNTVWPMADLTSAGTIMRTSQRRRRGIRTG